MKEFLRYKNPLVALAIIISIGIVLRNIHSHYSSQLEGLAKKEKKLEADKEIIAKWNRLNNEYNQLAERFLQRDTLRFKKFIERQAKTLEIDLTSLSLSPSDKDFYWEVGARLKTTCFYQDFVKFIGLLAEKKIEVAALHLSSAGNKVTVNANIKGVVLK